MARQCEFTGKKPLTGNVVSKSNNRTRTRTLPNLMTRRMYIEGLNKFVTLRLSARAIRTIDKHGGLGHALVNVNDRHFSDRLKRLKKQLMA